MGCLELLEGIVFLLLLIKCALYIFYIHTENIINSHTIFGEFLVKHPTFNSISKDCNNEKKYIVQEILIKILRV